MAIQLTSEQENRVAEAFRSGAYRSSEDVIDRALEVLRERDEWLTANREAIDAKIRTASKNWNAASASQRTSWMHILRD